MAASKAQRASTAARRAQAIKLRLAGWEWQEIADQLHYASRGAAQTDVKRAMDAHLTDLGDTVDQLRLQENMRLDRLMAAHWGTALKGNTKASEIVLRCFEQRRRLNGLDKRGETDADPSTALSMMGQLMAAIDGSVPEIPDVVPGDLAA